MWTTAPPKETQNGNHELLRCPKKGKIGVLITSRDLVGCWTHFLGRTLPCTDDDTCPACNDGAPRKWYGYLSVLRYNRPKQSILELPAGAANDLRDYQQTGAEIRGKLITLERKGGKANGRVVIELKQHPAWETLAQEPIQIEATLFRIWRIDPERVARSIQHRTEENRNGRKEMKNGQPTT